LVVELGADPTVEFDTGLAVEFRGESSFTSFTSWLAPSSLPRRASMLLGALLLGALLLGALLLGALLIGALTGALELFVTVELFGTLELLEALELSEPRPWRADAGFIKTVVVAANPTVMMAAPRRIRRVRGALVVVCSVVFFIDFSLVLVRAVLLTPFTLRVC
jgi:hypothetical protein